MGCSPWGHKDMNEWLTVSLSFLIKLVLVWGFPDSSVGKESACNAGDPGSIPGSGRSPGEGKVYTLQYSDLESSIVHGVTKSWTQLSDFHFHHTVLRAIAL